MKKYLVLFLLMMVLVPIKAIALDSNYVEDSLETALKSEEIENDLGNYTQSDDKITVYLFRGNGCIHCKHFLEYVSGELVKTHGDYFNFVSYEVWKNSDNKSLWQNVGKALGLEKVKGVPFIVIGEKYFTGYSESKNEELGNAILDLYNEAKATGDKKDIVKKVIEGKISLTEDEESKEVNGTSAALNNQSFRDTEKNKIFNSDLVIKISLSGCSTLLAVGLIVLLRRKNILK